MQYLPFLGGEPGLKNTKRTSRGELENMRICIKKAHFGARRMTEISNLHKKSMRHNCGNFFYEHPIIIRFMH